jgi:glucokinase
MKKFEKKGRASVERVVSGPGMANIYEFLTTHAEFEVVYVCVG